MMFIRFILDDVHKIGFRNPGTDETLKIRSPIRVFAGQDTVFGYSAPEFLKVGLLQVMPWCTGVKGSKGF
eukprot:8310133-Karenia_brevis.AAC.1